jgi:hypothetical protein
VFHGSVPRTIIAETYFNSVHNCVVQLSELLRRQPDLMPLLRAKPDRFNFQIESIFFQKKRHHTCPFHLPRRKASRFRALVFSKLR